MKKKKERFETKHWKNIERTLKKTMITAQVTLINSYWVWFIIESKSNESCLTSVNSLYQNNELKNN